jgi:hypothetical protein
VNIFTYKFSFMYAHHPLEHTAYRPQCLLLVQTEILYPEERFRACPELTMISASRAVYTHVDKTGESYAPRTILSVWKRLQAAFWSLPRIAPGLRAFSRITPFTQRQLSLADWQTPAADDRFGLPRSQ